MRASVIIPVYNGAATLKRTIESFLGQDFDPPGAFELVLCDDGSTDGTGGILKGYAGHPQVKVIFSENRGQSAASNLGARAAAGDILIFSAQDIVPAHPRYLWGHVQGHLAPKRPLCLTGYIRYPEELLDSEFMISLHFGVHQFDYYNIPDPGNLDPLKLYAPNFSVPRDWFFEVGGFDEELRYGFQDSELGVRFHLAGGKLALAEDLTVFHYHPQSFGAYCRRKRGFGRTFWYFYFKHRRYFETCRVPPWPLPVILDQSARVLRKRLLFERILREILFCQDRETDLVMDMYYEYSGEIEALPPLEGVRAATRRSYCLLLYYSAILTYCYLQGLAERAGELGLLAVGNLNLAPLKVEGNGGELVKIREVG